MDLKIGDKVKIISSQCTITDTRYRNVIGKEGEVCHIWNWGRYSLSVNIENFPYVFLRNEVEKIENEQLLFNFMYE